LTARLLTDFAELRILAAEWDRMWKANPKREVFTKFSWIDAWWKGYGGDAQLLAPAVFEEGRCVGILPLYVDGMVLRFIGAPAADYSDLICDPERASDILAAAITALDESTIAWHSCKLENVRESSLAVHAFNEPSSTLRGRAESRVSADCLAVLLDERRDETLKSILSKSTVSQMMRQLQKLGTLTFRHLDDRAKVREHLPSFYQQHVRCRALAGISSQMIEKRSRDFFAALVDHLDPQDELRFSVLELDGRPIAYNFGFQLDGKYLYYTPTYDIEYFDLSPGHVLLRNLFMYVRDNGLREFDFTVGDESYKSRYANHTTRNYEMIVYPRSASGTIARTTHAAKERLRSFPALYRMAKNSAAALAAVANRLVRVVKRDGLGRVAANAVIKGVRSAIYARNEVLVLLYVGPDVVDPSRVTTFRAATLSDLADAYAAHPDFRTRYALYALRERIKEGYTPYVAIENGEIVHIVWSRVDNRVAPAELGAGFAFEFGRPVGIMFDDWTPESARGKGAYPAALSRLGRHLRQAGLDPYVYVEATNVASRRGMAKVGLVVECRMIQSTWFHGIRRSVVR
jgi:CelD/BcsL family acetyltransferase involved in cellulose biosynthesis